MRRIAGEILSQLLNVPILTGILITYLYARMPTDLPAFCREITKALKAQAVARHATKA